MGTLTTSLHIISIILSTNSKEIRRWLLSLKTKINSKATRSYRFTTNLNRGRKQRIKKMFKTVAIKTIVQP